MHTEFVSNAEECVMQLLNSVFSDVYFIFGLLWPDTFTELGFLVRLVLLGDY